MMTPSIAASTNMRLSRPLPARMVFKSQRRPGSAAAARPRLVVRADEADRSKAQNTVGDLSPDQVRAALDRQVKLSIGEAGASTDQASTPASDDVSAEAAAEEVEQIEAEAPATDEERAESVRALQQLRDRVPAMSQADVDAAIQRLVGRGEAAFSDSSSSSGSSSSSSGGSSDSGSSGSSGGGSPAGSSGGDGAASEAQQSEPEQKQQRGKYDADSVQPDGSLVFSAESLAKVSFDELKP